MFFEAPGDQEPYAYSVTSRCHFVPRRAKRDGLVLGIGVIPVTRDLFAFLFVHGIHGNPPWKKEQTKLIVYARGFVFV